MLDRNGSIASQQDQEATPGLSVGPVMVRFSEPEESAQENYLDSVTF